MLTEPVKPPLLLVATKAPATDSAAVPSDLEQLLPAPPYVRSVSHQYSVLGAVLLGSLIAGAIIVLAFILRPAEDPPSQAVTPNPGAIIAAIEKLPT